MNLNHGSLSTLRGNSCEDDGQISLAICKLSAGFVNSRPLDA